MSGGSSRTVEDTSGPQVCPDLLRAAECQSEIQSFPLHARRRTPECRGRTDKRRARGRQFAQTRLVLIGPKLVRISWHGVLEFRSGTNVEVEIMFSAKRRARLLRSAKPQIVVPVLRIEEGTMTNDADRTKARELMTRAERMAPGKERDAMIRKAERLARSTEPPKPKQSRE